MVENTCNCARMTIRSEEDKKLLSNRCNRIEGQIRGIKGMIDRDVYCDDILHQIAAAQSALNSLGKIILEQHMHSCIVDRIQEGDNTVIDELLVTIGKLMK
ncbi:metal-sensitive transcriptional regulator [Fusibacter tunisiensis]|uniref:DNA-binding FrmR family transcriptional regulator n=1 Tax=Fusibacter tunisiensis TaxID=1008308 RepID=A0ABS2MN09_9FIRM|nr:metal-sensitive transcriptional regulator [Fusibacter tunisiensis]MBM7560785.1 DNA-binding FrmR family transcriptional regulator [Fusibacter tunisiensis]